MGTVKVAALSVTLTLLALILYTLVSVRLRPCPGGCPGCTGAKDAPPVDIFAAASSPDAGSALANANGEGHRAH